MPSIGIYKITNIMNNKCYIGSSSNNIETRWRRHKSDLNRNKHPNKHLQASWNKYNKEFFKFEIIKLCKPRDCIKREQYYIDTLKPEYNKNPKAGSSLGRIVSQETREKMSKAHKGVSKNLGNTFRRGKRNEFFSKTKLIAKDIKTNQTLNFHSFIEAEKQGFNKGEIKRHIAGRRKSYAGYIWSFGGELSLV